MSDAPACPRPDLSPFTHRFLKLAGPFWLADKPRPLTERAPDKYRHLKARALTLGLVVLTVGQVLIPVAINKWSALLFDTLEQRNVAQLPSLIAWLSGVLVYAMGVNAGHLWVKREILYRWREWLTKEILRHWMDNGRQYEVSHQPGLEGKEDNPDGRIAEDIRISTEAAVDLCHSLFYCVLLLASFTQILWSLSGEMTVHLGSFAIPLPGSLVWIALLYAATGTSAALLLGRPLVRAVNLRQTREANFRFGLIRARENAETIALLDGETGERRRLYQLFEAIGQAWSRQTAALRNITAFTSGYSTLSGVFPILVVAPRYISGSITLGTLMQTAQAFQQMSAALSWPIDNLARVAEWRASVERVLALKEALEITASPVSCRGQEGITLIRNGGSALAFHELRVDRPDGETIIEPFNLTLHPGEKVLLSGDPLAALRLFKVVTGLWPWGQGVVDRPSGLHVLFFPRRPYLPGTLMETLIYPKAYRDPWKEQQVKINAKMQDQWENENEKLVKRAHEALEILNLTPLIGRLHDQMILDKTLSVPEQRRLGFARLLMHDPGPHWIFIQEAIEALDPTEAAFILPRLERHLLPATVINVGQRPVCPGVDHHRLGIVPTDKGSFRVITLPPFPASASLPSYTG
ncbi:ABC transporter ATP-binding protein/permease [Pararhodospirillum photometricum]|nr:SbmA/BacA-like family transporter [Pararhodospirillum photometricum]